MEFDTVCPVLLHVTAVPAFNPIPDLLFLVGGVIVENKMQGELRRGLAVELFEKAQPCDVGMFFFNTFTELHPSRNATSSCFMPWARRRMISARSQSLLATVGALARRLSSTFSWSVTKTGSTGRPFLAVNDP